MKTVAVFFGGRSNEHEISVITGMLAVNLLRGAEYRVMPVYLPAEGGMCAAENARGVDDFLSRNGKTLIPAALNGNKLVRADKRKKILCEIDCALNCCHGGMGEDGTLAALLRWHGVVSASPDTAASAVFMDKALSKIAAKGLGLDVVEGFCVQEDAWKKSRQDVLAKAAEFGYPVIVKPLKLGSSIGIAVAKGEEELVRALQGAFLLDEGVLIERYLTGKRDINCAAYRGNRLVVSECEEVFSGQTFLTFAEKYEGTGESRNSRLPADLPAELSQKIKDATALIYESFHMRGMVRADFIVCGEKAYFNELNTVPGSLACYLFGESLSEAKKLLVALVEGAAAKKEKAVVTTGILHSDIFSGAKSCKKIQDKL